MEATEREEFEAAFRGEELPEPKDEAPKEETQDEPQIEQEIEESAPESELENETNAETSVDSEIAGLSTEALETIEQKITAAVEQKLSGRLRNLEGNFGGIKQKVDMLATAKAAAKKADDAPTAQQIKEASTDGEKMQTLREDFPEFAEALDERLQAVSQNQNHNEVQEKLSAAEAHVAKTAEELQKLHQIRHLDKVHPDWEDVVKTEQYANWLHNQPQNVIEAANNSNDARDAIQVLNMYKEASKTSPKSKRLEDAITPTQGGQAIRPSRKTESEEFEAAFKSAR